MAKNDNAKTRITKRQANFAFASVPPEKHTNIVNSAMAITKLAPIDLHDVNQVAIRLDEFFGICAQYGVKPTVSGLAQSLGMSRQTLSGIVHDKTIGGNNAHTALPTITTDLLKKVYNSMEIMMESYMITGQINPITGIFLSKNMFGYVDKVEHVVQGDAKRIEDYDKQSIQDRYAFDATPALDAGDSSNPSDSSDSSDSAD